MKYCKKYNYDNCEIEKVINKSKFNRNVYEQANKGVCILLWILLFAIFWYPYMVNERAKKELLNQTTATLSYWLLGMLIIFLYSLEFSGYVNSLYIKEISPEELKEKQYKCYILFTLFALPSYYLLNKYNEKANKIFKGTEK